MRQKAWSAAFARFFVVSVVCMSASLAPTVRADDEPRVFPDAASVEPLAVGSPIPAVRIRTIDAEAIDLRKAIGDRGALLVFYRGGW